VSVPSRALFGVLAGALALVLGHAASAEPVRVASLLDSVPSPHVTVPGDVGLAPAGAFLFYEDFEHGALRWDLTRSGGPVGWYLLNASNCGGLYTMALGLKDQKAGKLTEGGWSVLTGPWIDLRKAKKPVLKFDVKGEVTPAEAVTVYTEVSKDGRAWQQVGYPTQARYMLMQTRVADLKAYVGTKVQLRFRAVWTPSRTDSKGLFLDDIHVIEPM
jgi:hypothetical protein